MLVNGVDYYQSMRKSLGSKRKELSDEHIQQLTNLYGDMKAGPHVKIFDNKDFGFQRITVERPLRLQFQITAEALKNLDNETAWANLLKSKKKEEDKKQEEIKKGTAIQKAVLDALNALDKNKVYDDRALFLTDFKAKLPKGTKLAAGVIKAVWKAIGEVSEDAKPCKDSKGKIEPDTSLRDNENVPLKGKIEEYMKREVLPHVPDAWVDESKTTIGYEIPFTRHFYVYEPPRSLDSIEDDLKALESQIQTLTAEVMV